MKTVNHKFPKPLETFSKCKKGIITPTLSKQEMVEEVSDRMVEGWQHISSDIVELACRKYLAPRGYNVIIKATGFGKEGN